MAEYLVEFRQPEREGGEIALINPKFVTAAVKVSYPNEPDVVNIYINGSTYPIQVAASMKTVSAKLNSAFD